MSQNDRRLAVRIILTVLIAASIMAMLIITPEEMGKEALENLWAL